MSAADLGVAPGARTTLEFGALYSSATTTRLAPEPGYAPFSFTAGSPCAAPSAPGSGPRRPDVRPRRPSGDLAPRGAQLRAVAARRRVAHQPRLDSRLGRGAVAGAALRARKGRPVSKTVRGAGAAGTRSVTKTVVLPSSWRGSRVSAQLAVSNDGRTIHRGRTVLIPR